MRRRLGMGIMLLIGLLLLTEVLSAEEQETCDGPYKGKKVSSEELAIVLENHRRWVEKESEGQQANLCEANLLRANLLRANLQGANLREANLQEANLYVANLQEADLLWANLQEANLADAKLQNAALSEANLQKASLPWANLQEATLRVANLQEATLHRANLQNANLSEAKLQNANLSEAKLQNANLSRANLQEADFTNVDLTGAHYVPSSAPAKGFLGGITGLSTVWFYPGEQSGLVLLRAALKDVGLRALEREATYALKYMERCYNWLAFCPSQGPVLVYLPYLATPGLFATLEGLFHFFFFELTCDYGLTPGRPLLLLLGFILVFACVYVRALRTTSKQTGLWVTYSADRTYKRHKQQPVARLFSPPDYWMPSSGSHKDKRRESKREWRALVTHRPWQPVRKALTDASGGLTDKYRTLFAPTPAIKAAIRWYVCALAPEVRAWWRTCRIALYFSLLSAFHLGWKELTVGTWLSRMQKRPYTLSATGWVRAVSGLQSLLSVYLLALWALTYFGRPFE